MYKVSVENMAEVILVREVGVYVKKRELTFKVIKINIFRLWLERIKDSIDEVLFTFYKDRVISKVCIFFKYGFLLGREKEREGEF